LRGTLSLSLDPKQVGRPVGFDLPVDKLRLAARAGFIAALCGEIPIMPGLATSPAGERIEIHVEGRISGLY
jgi:formate--tetrahydrofolate ligase